MLLRETPSLKNRLTSAEIREIIRITREPTNPEKQNPEDVRVIMENMTLEQNKDTVEQVI